MEQILELHFVPAHKVLEGGICDKDGCVTISCGHCMVLEEIENIDSTWNSRHSWHWNHTCHKIIQETHPLQKLVGLDSQQHIFIFSPTRAYLACRDWSLSNCEIVIVQHWCAVGVLECCFIGVVHRDVEHDLQIHLGHEACGKVKSDIQIL